MKLRDKLWIWGQDAGSHHNTLKGNIWNLPGENHLGPTEGCQYLGIPNCCRVVMHGLPMPPFDHEAEKMDCLRSVVWSVIGDCESVRNDNDTDLEEVIRIARLHPNTSGAILDDFMSEKRRAIFTPERLKQMRERLHTALDDQQLDFWTVLYMHELSEAVVPWIKEVDIVTLWAWHAEELEQLDESHKKLKLLMADNPKPVLAGCYLYDYGGRKPMPMDIMRQQMDTYYRWLQEKEIDGIVFCSNAIADIGLEAADYVKQWIECHGDEEIPD